MLVSQKRVVTSAIYPFTKARDNVVLVRSHPVGSMGMDCGNKVRRKLPTARPGCFLCFFNKFVPCKKRNKQYAIAS